nr:MAG TPA: hypothetical protein [Caudoviricetes sp.]
MLQLEISGGRLFDEETSRFIITPAVTLQLEHSLLSLSKWEADHCRPFVNAKDLTDDELMDYIVCMSDRPITRVDLTGLRDEHLEKLQAYLENPHTATTINSPNRDSSSQIITSELIYSWMVALRIPFECERWNLNRLITLIRVCSINNNPDKKKLSQDEVARQYREINAKRRAEAAKRGF